MKELLGIFNITDLSDEEQQKFAEGLAKSVKKNNEASQEESQSEAIARYLKTIGQIKD